jgi:hypothetical protein
MPYQANIARRHQFPKAKYQVKNWGEYDQALPQRGSLTVLGHPGGDRRLAGAAHGPARSVSLLFESGDRDRASTTPGVWSTVAANGRPVALHRDLTWDEPSGS